MSRYEMPQSKADAVTYGIELIFDSLFKLLGILLLGILFGCAWEMVLAVACFSTLRSQAGGFHMKSDLGCFLVVLSVCVLACVGAEYIQELPAVVLAVLSVAILILNKKYAPFFTENNPIEDEQIIKKKNRGAVIFAAAFLLIIWIVPVWKVKLLMLIPVTLETLSILPCWHGKKKRNE